MAFTSDEEARVRAMLAAFEGGQQVDDLPLATNEVQDKIIEVFDTKSGASGYMGLKDAVRMAGSPSCGRVWNEDNATPKAATWFGSLEMLRNLPDILGLGCYLVKNDHSRRKLDPTNHYRFANGETAKLDGSMGHYQWGWGKKWYFATYNIGPLRYEEISLSPIPGQYNYVIPVGSMSASGLASMERSSGTLVSYINDDANYRGGDNTSSYDGTYRTLLGRCATNMTVESFRAAARKNGSGWMGSSMRHQFAVKVLFDVIMGTHYDQSAFNATKDADGLWQCGLGAGTTTLSSTEWSNYNGYRPFLHTSAGVELGDAVGTVSVDVPAEDGSVFKTVSVPVFFGLKHLSGYIWRMMDDEFGQVNADTSITHLVAPSIYGTWTVGNASGMVAYSTSPTNSSGYIKKLSMDNCELWTTQIGGSETTYETCHFWNTSGAVSGFRLCLRGGVASNGGQCGLSSLDVSNAVSDASVYYGSSLCEAEEDWSVVPVYEAA